MIFVTVGSHPTFKFQRLLDLVAVLPGDELVVQYGPADPPVGVGEARPWLSFHEVVECMQAARVVISHVGVGTVICANNLGHVPVVVPRLRRYGETVDDHQLELAMVLQRSGQAAVAWRDEQLAPLVSASTHAFSGMRTDHGLEQAVRGALLEPAHRQDRRVALRAFGRRPHAATSRQHLDQTMRGRRGSR